MILCDTDIFIEALKNNLQAVSLLRDIGFENIPDALIAATAISHHMQLLTNNVKDFRFIEGIALYPRNKK